MSRYITPFNLFLFLIALVAAYAVWLMYENWRFHQNLREVAPGHVVAANAPQSETIDVIMFYDYSCPHCLAADPIIHQAIAEDGKTNLIYKFIGFFGERSVRTGKLAYAGGQQDAFMDVHQYIMTHPETPFEEDDVREMAAELGLDADQLLEDMNSRTAARTLEENLDVSHSMNMRATPAFLINGWPFIPYKSMPDVEGFQEMFDRARGGQPLM